MSDLHWSEVSGEAARGDEARRYDIEPYYPRTIQGLGEAAVDTLLTLYGRTKEASLEEFAPLDTASRTSVGLELVYALAFEDQFAITQFPEDMPPSARRALHARVDSWRAVLPFTQGERSLLAHMYRESEDGNSSFEDLDCYVTDFGVLPIYDLGLRARFRGFDLERRWKSWIESDHEYWSEEEEIPSPALLRARGAMNGVVRLALSEAELPERYRALAAQEAIPAYIPPSP